MAQATVEALTARESAVLDAVGRRLGNAEIAAEMFISVRTVESHIASLRRKLDADSRAKLIAASQAHRGLAVQVPQNSFVGRTHDVEAVRTLLGVRRWVTVIGPAGCGKTRLALEVAATLDRAPVIVELEHARGADVPGVVAKALGLGVDSSSDPATACGLAMAPHRHLLVLDNCDRVTGAVADLVSRLMTLAGSLVVLATSRSPIGSSDEAIHQLEPLPVDGESGAMRLFLDRARAAAPTVELSDDDLELLGGICARLDGLPLAIEMAAARMRHLPLPELAARLEDGFGPLAGAGPPSRHRTLEAAFDWTWDLLDPEEKSVLSRLAALPLSFDVDLAEAVSGPGAGHVVYRLLDRSLISPAAKPATPRRFRLLDSLRAFVLDRTESPIVEDVHRSHARHHESRATALTERSRTDDSREAALEANRLCPELNAALNWALVHDPKLALALARALSVGSEQFGADSGSLASIARAARDPHVLALSSATDLLLIGIALCYDDLDLVFELSDRALSLANDDCSRLAAEHLAGYTEAYRQNGASALKHLELAEDLAERLDDTWQLASIRQARGLALRSRELDRPAAAIDQFESAMHTYARAGDAMHVNNARYMMAATAAHSGHRREEALVWVDQCAEYALESGNRHELAHALLTRAALAPEEVPDLDMPLDIFLAVGDLRCLARTHLLRADRLSASDGAAALEQALQVARRAHDVDNQATALERLIQAHWVSGAHRAAVLALGALTNLVGQDLATSRCPAEMVEELGQWDTAIAEGRAHWPVP